MAAFGKVSYDAPSSISLYADSFEDKDAIAACIETFNAGQPEEEQITYTDYVAMLTSSITTIIDGISYVLIAFVSISLVVSCIMIGIITHISVLERTKEIGILRALGASQAEHLPGVQRPRPSSSAAAPGCWGSPSPSSPWCPSPASSRTCRGSPTSPPSSPWRGP